MKTCKQCGDEFVPVVPHQNYCSRDTGKQCGLKANRLLRYSPEKMTSATCEGCGATFAKQRHANKRFCSEKCRAISRQQKWKPKKYKINSTPMGERTKKELQKDRDFSRRNALLRCAEEYSRRAGFPVAEALRIMKGERRGYGRRFST